MDLPVYTNNALAQLRESRKNAFDDQVVKSIVHQVHSAVISRAKEGRREYTWNSDAYLFDNYTQLHVINACKCLQELFPDAQITRPKPKEILVQWY